MTKIRCVVTGDYMVLWSHTLNLHRHTRNKVLNYKYDYPILYYTSEAGFFVLSLTRYRQKTLSPIYIINVFCRRGAKLRQSGLIARSISYFKMGYAANLIYKSMFMPLNENRVSLHHRSYLRHNRQIPP